MYMHPINVVRKQGLIENIDIAKAIFIEDQ